MIEQRKSVSADGVKAAVSQHQQTRKTNNHVQPETEDNVDHGQSGDIHRPTRHHKRPRHRKHQQRHEEQFLLHRGAINRGQNKLRPGNAFQPFLESRSQNLEEKDHRRADKHPLPTDIRSGVDHQFGAIQLQLHAHKDARQDKEHRGREQRHCNMHRFHTFSTSGRPRIPVGITSSTRISRANETTSLYSVLR